MDTMQPITSVQQPQSQIPVKKKGMKFSTILLFIGIVLIVAAIAFVAIFFFVQSKQKISYAPPFPKTSPMPSAIPIEATPEATIIILPTGTNSPIATLTPSPTSTSSAITP